MNVGIDISSIMYGRGVSRYTSNLTQALLKQKDVTLSLYGASWRQNALLEREAHFLARGAKVQPQIKIQSIPPSFQNFLWNWAGQNKIESLFPDLDVFHSWDWLQPPDKSLPLVSTIHDLAILKFPETAHPQILKMHQKSWKILREREAQVIAVSRSTKRDIVELLDIPSQRVHVVYEALPSEVVRVSESLSDEDSLLIKYKLKLGRPFIFFVGTREPRKNLERLIEAWEPLAKDVDLLIAGDVGWDTTEARAKVNTPNLRFLGRVSDKQLAVLYGEAEAFVYPSLYEGFGLPILESFYYGTPVVTSNVSSMVEVAGNAAELIDPLSVESLRAGIEKVLGESLVQQKKRLQQMIIRLQLFNWDQVAEETVKVYRRAMESQS